MSTFRFLPEAASTLAWQVDALYLALIAVSLFFSLLIAGLVVRFMLVYRRRSPAHVPPRVHVPIWLEILWTSVPLAIVMVFFLWGARLFAALSEPPPGALEVYVVGKQWMWKLQHLEGRREIDELHVPIGRPVKLTMTSEDVIHSFYVPAFRTKQDVVPGRYSTVWFEATKTGSYHLFCAEYCGTLHSGMIGRVIAMEPAAFQEWLAGTSGGVAAPSMADAGAELFVLQGCPSCHASGAEQRGPRLERLFGSTVRLADGRTVVADEAYLRESILDSNAKVVAGFQPVMPTYRGLLTEEQVLQLITYVKGLGTEAGS